MAGGTQSLGDVMPGDHDYLTGDWPLPRDMGDYCPICDGIHHPVRHQQMAALLATVVPDEGCMCGLDWCECQTGES